MTAIAQHTPVYLDETQPIERRIDDALSRMTLQEKIRVIHAQSKFSSAGQTTVLTVYALTYCGTNGNRQDRPTTHAWRFLR